jgi:hypothetical protein
MVKFGKFIESNVKKEWEKNYLDYNKLKEIIKTLSKNKKEATKKYEEYFQKGQTKDDISQNIEIKEKQTENDFTNTDKPIKKLLTKEDSKSYETPDGTKDQGLVAVKTQSSGKLRSNSLRKSSHFKNKEHYEALLQSTIGEYIDEFISELDFEIKKFFMFFKNLEKKLYREVNLNLKKELNFSDYSFIEIYKELISIEELCSLILEVCSFINVNVTGVRKILKKFDKKFELDNNPIALFYLGNNLEDPESALLYILKFKCIDDCSALVEKIIKDLEYALDKKIQSYKNNNRRVSVKCVQDLESALEEPLIQKEIKIEELSMEKSDLIEMKIKNKINKCREKLEEIDEGNNMIRTSVEVWTLVIQNNLRMIKEKDSEFKVWKSKTKALLANNETIIKNLTPQIREHAAEEKPSHNLVSIWICLIHTCINSLNARIVFPTNSKYISSIGASAFLTGIVIAATHFSAIGATFVYSSWTNYSYRKPLLFSICLYFLGNICYAYAGYFETIYLMILGKFLMGCGSARVVNRRYLIDHVEEAHLLHYSMLYVVTTSLGNVLGPLSAVFLLLLDDVYLFNGLITLNEFTWPVWFCSIFWVVGIVVVYIYFEEPANLIIKQKMIEEENKKKKEYDDIRTGKEEDRESLVNNSFVQFKEDLENSYDDKIQASLSTSFKDKDIGFVERDLKEIIKDQETNVLSYMTVAFTILIMTLALIRVSTR